MEESIKKQLIESLTPDGDNLLLYANSHERNKDFRMMIEGLTHAKATMTVNFGDRSIGCYGFETYFKSLASQKDMDFIKTHKFSAFRLTTTGEFHHEGY